MCAFLAALLSQWLTPFWKVQIRRTWLANPSLGKWVILWAFSLVSLRHVTEALLIIGDASFSDYFLSLLALFSSLAIAAFSTSPWTKAKEGLLSRSNGEKERREEAAFPSTRIPVLADQGHLDDDDTLESCETTTRCWHDTTKCLSTLMAWKCYSYLFAVFKALMSLLGKQI